MRIKEIEQYLVSKAINKNLSKTSANPEGDFPNREEALIELKKLQNKLHPPTGEVLCRSTEKTANCLTRNGYKW